MVEMARNEEDSFCCGGGGGQMWMETDADKRINQHRLEDALQANAETVATACPYCIRMLNDAVRELGVENQIAVRDLAELLLESVGVSDIEDKNERFIASFDQEECHV